MKKKRRIFPILLFLSSVVLASDDQKLEEVFVKNQENMEAQLRQDNETRIQAMESSLEAEHISSQQQQEQQLRDDEINRQQLIEDSLK